MKDIFETTISAANQCIGPLLKRMEELSTRPVQNASLTVGEDSIALRIVITLMAFMVIAIACFYADASLLVTLVYLCVALVGSYLAYLYRDRNMLALKWVMTLLPILIMANFGQEIFMQLYIGRLAPLVPFVMAVTGLQALHMFDLRTRTDINISAAIGLGLLACTAAIARDGAFGVGVFLYICLISAVLFLQSVHLKEPNYRISLTKSELFEERPQPIKPKAFSSVNSFLAIASLPVIAFIIFLVLPRIDTIVDRITVALSEISSPTGVSIAMRNGLPTGPVDVYRPSISERGLKNGKALGGGGADDSSQRNGITAQGLMAPQNEQSKASSLSFAKNHNVKPESKPQTVSESAKMNLADPETEGEMTLVYGSKGAVATEDKVLFTVAAPRELYLRRMCFDTFDGLAWHLRKQRLEDEVAMNPDVLYNLSKYGGLKQSRAPGIDVEQNITIMDTLGHFIAAAWQPSELAFPADKIYVDGNGVMRSADGIANGAKYRVISHIPIYDLDALRAGSVDPVTAAQARQTLAHELTLPSNLDPEVPMLAKGIVVNGGSWFGCAEAICQYLRKNFNYSLSQVEAPKNTKNLVNYFLLESKAGDCTHFASAFVVMCRSVGIPARCVGGFAPGSRNIITGLVEIRPAQSHAWAEVYIPNSGWVPFDPVPGGYLPEQKPSEGFLASLAHSDAVRSMSQLITSFKNEKLKTASKETAMLDDDGRASGSDTASSASKVLNAQGRRLQPVGGTSTESGQRQFGIAPGSLSVSFGNNSSNRFEAFVRGHTLNIAPVFNLNWLKKNWLPITLLLTLVPASCLLFLKRQTPIAVSKSPLEKNPRGSTRAFLRVVDDLSQIEFLRLPEDTPSEIVHKVCELLETNTNEEWRRDLPTMLAEFMDLYCRSRFTGEESPDSGTKLEQMGNNIHRLLTSEQKAS